MKPLVPIHVVSVAVVYGWLVSSGDERWNWRWSKYFSEDDPSRVPAKHRAMKYAKQIALKLGGGTVKIHSRTGRIQEERTYPRSRDPKRSPG